MFLILPDAAIVQLTVISKQHNSESANLTKIYHAYKN